MLFEGLALSPTPGAVRAPYIIAIVDVVHPLASSDSIAATFMVDTGADRTLMSLRKARQLIGDANWEAVCRSRKPVTLGGIGGSQMYWEVPMRLWFRDSETEHFFYFDRDVLVPPYSEVLDLAEQEAEVRRLPPVFSLLGRDVFGGMRFEFDLNAPSPVIFR